MGTERLQKLIARAGLASRRGAEQLIVDGRVRVNGTVAQIGQSADPAVDSVEVDGQRLPTAGRAIHLAIHKPRGFLSSAFDERGRRSVVSLVDTGGERLWPAGRLDVDSEGLMILTNDGEWANRILHPRYGTIREYAVLVHPAPSREDLQRLRVGVELDDGPAHVLDAKYALPPREVERERDESGAWLQVRIGEGRKREVRRLFAALDAGVDRLVRIGIGPLRISGLSSGQWRDLRPEEVASLSGARRR